MRTRRSADLARARRNAASLYLLIRKYYTGLFLPQSLGHIEKNIFVHAFEKTNTNVQTKTILSHSMELRVRHPIGAKEVFYASSGLNYETRSMISRVPHVIP